MTSDEDERILTRQLAREYVEGLRARIRELEARLKVLEGVIENGRRVEK